MKTFLRAIKATLYMLSGFLILTVLVYLGHLYPMVLILILCLLALVMFWIAIFNNFT